MTRLHLRFAFARLVSDRICIRKSTPPCQLKQGGVKARVAPPSSVVPALMIHDGSRRNRLDTRQETVARGERSMSDGLAFVRLGQSKQFHRLLRSGTSFGSGIEKLSWIGVDADFRHTAALPDHFIEGSHGIVPMGT